MQKIFLSLQGPHYSFTTIQKFTEQIAGIVIVFTLVKLNDGFMIEKPNTLRPSLKMTIPRPLLTTSKPLDITSSGKRLFMIRFSNSFFNCVTVQLKKSGCEGDYQNKIKEQKTPLVVLMGKT